MKDLINGKIPNAKDYEDDDLLTTYPLSDPKTIRHVTVVIVDGRKAIKISGHVIEWDSFFELNRMR